MNSDGVAKVLLQRSTMVGIVGLGVAAASAFGLEVDSDIDASFSYQESSNGNRRGVVSFGFAQRSATEEDGSSVVVERGEIISKVFKVLAMN